VTEAQGPPSDRASVPPRVLWLQTRLLLWEGSAATTCPVALGPQGVPKTLDIRPIMALSGTRCRQRIKCVCEVIRSVCQALNAYKILTWQDDDSTTQTYRAYAMGKQQCEVT
jgi:hypothetical protein